MKNRKNKKKMVFHSKKPLNLVLMYVRKLGQLGLTVVKPKPE